MSSNADYCPWFIRMKKKLKKGLGKRREKKGRENVGEKRRSEPKKGGDGKVKKTKKKRGNEKKGMKMSMRAELFCPVDNHTLLCRIYRISSPSPLSLHLSSSLPIFPSPRSFLFLCYPSGQRRGGGGRGPGKSQGHSRVPQVSFPHPDFLFILPLA